MLSNWIIIAIRNFIKYRIFSLVNVLGLAFGIAISILIFILVKQELNYDKYHKYHERIYRVNLKAEAFEYKYNSALTPFNLSVLIKQEIPEVEQTVRVLKGSHKKISCDDNHYSANRFYYTDQSVFDIFSIPVLRGDKKTLLTEKFTVVITEETARKYFGSKDPLGEIIYLDNGWKFRVTGVCKSAPENTHLHFDFLASLVDILSDEEAEDWSSWPVATYVLLNEGAKPSQITEDLDIICEKKLIPVINDYFSSEIITGSYNNFFEFYLQPLTNIHFSTDISGQFEAGRQKGYLYIFSILAGIILFIACVNYMNLSTARLSTRTREVALRKVVGATRGQMMLQFFSESIFFSLLATFIALVIIELILKPFNILSGFNLEQQIFNWWFLLPVLLAGTVCVGIISGSYPALYLSGFSVVNIMKRTNYSGSGSTRFRGILVLSQFTLSIALIISSFIIYNQVKYLQEKNLGFNKSNVVVLQRAYALMKEKEKFKELLKEHPGIINASVSYTLPGEDQEQIPFWIGEEKKKQVRYLTYMTADADFVETMQMHLLEGADFNENNLSREHQIVINESAARELDLQKPVGTEIIPVGAWDKEDRYKIIGVVNDYHYESLRKEIKPMALLLLDPDMHVQNLVVRLTGKDIPATMEYIEKTWKKFTGNEPFDYYFLDKDLDMLYREEKRTAGIFGVFSILAIFIASLGLFGLAAHTAELRTREIGIRKAMGASVQKIIVMLVSNFTRWVFWAILIAFPLSYFVMKMWLGKFAYHINIELWFFFLAALLAVIAALITVSFQSLKSAKASPVQALQYE
jgi:putative ABC transport system permease protein